MDAPPFPEITVYYVSPEEKNTLILKKI